MVSLPYRRDRTRDQRDIDIIVVTCARTVPTAMPICAMPAVTSETSSRIAAT